MSSSAEPVAIAAAPGGLVRRVWRAPPMDRAAVIAPAWSEAANIAATNTAGFAALMGDVQGKSWSELQAWTRSACLAAASDYLEELGLPTDAATANGPIIVGGHQPELFHPGVWAKNFAVHALARQTRGVGVQLIVDNDTLTRSAIRVPAGNLREPRAEWLPFDDPQPAQPWEEARVANPALFASFGERVAEAMRAWGIEPVVSEFWPQAVAASQRDLRLADCLTAVRIAAERNWHAGNLELPLSRICEQPPFLWFAAAVLARAEEFARHHNAVLGEYRRLNRVRSRSHPVPELASVDGWTEVPFWIWRAGDRRRERLFVKRSGDEVWLRSREDVILRLSLTPGRSAAAAVEQLQTFPALGWRLRTRALTTTLFARLCLADLFVHGLGGAKYDEMTDALMRRFFDIHPPEFLTVTATAHLPLGQSETVSAEDVGRLRHSAWDLVHNPQRHLDGIATDGAAALVTERQQLVQSLLAPSDRRQRATRRQAYLRVHEINHELAELLDDRRRALESDVAKLERRRAANRILKSREFSWVLYPAELLRGFYAGLFPSQPGAPATE
ncbi:MAG TPA: hypothetical protein VM165_03405 [Planctomycetaceae bacterium]|nr:hypothetical protein [Planctomycetaceae bacterium]